MSEVDAFLGSLDDTRISVLLHSLDNSKFMVVSALYRKYLRHGTEELIGDVTV